MNADLLALESLVAIAGVIAPKVTEAKIEASFRLSSRLARRLDKWMKTPDLRAFELPRDRDAQKTFDSLGSKYDIEPPVENAFDAVEFSAKVQECRTELVSRFPISYARDKLQDLPLPLSPDEEQDWLADVSMIEDETRVLDEIEMGTITAGQVELYRKLFPNLYEFLALTAEDVVIEFNGKGESLSEVVETTMEIFLNQWRVKPAQAQDGSAPQESVPGPDVKLSGDTTATQSERAEL
jgi:hypothetical protein